jgi:hypothetical protein
VGFTQKDETYITKTEVSLPTGMMLVTFDTAPQTSFNFK